MRTINVLLNVNLFISCQIAARFTIISKNLGKLTKINLFVHGVNSLFLESREVKRQIIGTSK